MPAAAAANGNDPRQRDAFRGRLQPIDEGCLGELQVPRQDRCLDQVAEGHAERPGDPPRDGQRRVGPAPLDLAEHGAADAARGPHLLQSPAPLAPQFADAVAQHPTDGLVARDALVELGYSVVDAERALADVDPELSAEERVRVALKKAA